MRKNNKLFIIETLMLLTVAIINFKIIFAFIFVIIHEVSHIIVAKIYGLKVSSLKINVVGSRSDIYDIDNLAYIKRMIVYLVGPLVNLFLGLIFFVLMKYTNITFFYEAYIINLGLGIFNLIPAYPLDGSRILEILLEIKVLYKTSKKIVVIFSFIVVILLLMIFMFSIYIHKINISFILVAIVIAYSSIIEAKKTMYTIIKSLYKKENLLINKNYLENKNICIYYKCSLIKALSFIDRNKFNCFYVLNEGLKVLGIVYEEELIEAIKNYGNINFKEYMETKNKK
ncbi:MAG: M50 family metallopeptidase [Clostridium sp.]|nr:M50 family metallopeptidase [Clostridium sp.]